MVSDNLVSAAYDSLKRDIIHGEYGPNDRLVMARLREKYFIGASPIREALSKLLSEGLVVFENQKGFRVTPVSVSELRDIYEARAHLESLLVELSIEKGDDIWEANIIAASHRLFKFGSLDQLEGISISDWEERHHAFHDALVSGCASPILLEVRQTLYEKAARYRNLWLLENVSQSKAYDANLSEHKTLMNAALDRDTKTAKNMVYNHILVPVKIIEEVF